MNNELQSVAPPLFTYDTEVIDLLKQNIEDLKAEKEYWKREYEKKTKS